MSIISKAYSEQGEHLMNARVPSGCCSGAEGWVFRRSRFDQWQVLQEPPPQVAQPDEDEETYLPLLLKLAADMRRSTLFPLHVGQHTSLSFPKTRHSNSFLHFLHLNS